MTTYFIIKTVVLVRHDSNPFRERRRPTVAYPKAGGRDCVHRTRIPKADCRSKKARGRLDEGHRNALCSDSLRRLRRVLRRNSIDSRIAHAHCRSPFSTMDAVDNMVLNQQVKEKVR